MIKMIDSQRSVCILLYVETNTQRKGERESCQGRKRIVDGVDVISVRSANEAAENQSFLR